MPSVVEISNESSIKQHRLSIDLTNAINKHEDGMTINEIIGVLEVLKLSVYGQHLAHLD